MDFRTQVSSRDLTVVFEEENFGVEGSRGSRTRRLENFED
jgi:hypothetical protein